MGVAEEIPRWVNLEKRPCVDVQTQTQRHSPISMAAAVSKVLDDDNLLVDIIVRIGFPTTLVRAALICKRWLCHISDRKFLSRFRKLHPPRLLGFYIEHGWVIPRSDTPHFVPMLPQPPELAAVVRRVASHNFGAHEQLRIVDCWNGSVFTSRLEGEVLAQGVYRPLCPETGLCIIPPLPTAQDPAQQIFGGILSKEEGGCLSYLYVLAEWIREARNFRMRVYMLQDGIWCMHASATHQILDPLSAPKVVLVGNKIYMAAAFSDDIIVFDLTASSLSRIPLPQGVKYHYFTTTLSRADDASGVYLTHAHHSVLQLQIWLHKGDNWLLVHTISLHEMWVNLSMLDHTIEYEHIGFPCICQVGDNAEFLFLKMGGYTLHLDVTRRTMRKVLGRTENDQHFSAINPFMMIWPPTFPALKDDPDCHVKKDISMLLDGQQLGLHQGRAESCKFLSSSSNCRCYNS